MNLLLASGCPPGAKVVLCTDLVSTENAVRRAAMTVAGGEADPLVIACVVDARDTRGPVRLLNRAFRLSHSPK